MLKQARKPIKWVSSAKRDLNAMPEDVKDVFGHAIDLAQAGGKHQDAKAMTGFGSAGVLEVVEDHQGDTYRAVYTVKFAGWVYVLHCFQKKSKSGIATPKPDMDLINTRLKAAKQDFEAWQAQQGVRK
ncbi:MAG: type II toxin-antitoxin system RelE/ParE family toxin [Hydrogenophaga sp.]|uniref:type II toxin-antitoxin system RelE/ParE family toxin n=1 Tax=Hydrogenophaga sp. TaxID=1904254 RepID=UPI00261C0BFF|nr:type II toxin-antitoxin system RelE/ParE family toxin [Hydrogenophaga sp.]MDP2016193.1 type II toxin-antitoxin system RelE/ParE family toxin [Hydrogenophaga sp.]MDZ4125731.1 type II toxin-antitoxin system RelE/ParE family toxin [Hydrogenophaga sp.]